MSYYPIPPAYTQSKMITVNFGALGVDTGTFVFSDPNVTTNSKLTGAIAYVAPPGKDLDELEFDNFDIMFTPGAGSFTVTIRALDGLVADNFIIYYTASNG